MTLRVQITLTRTAEIFRKEKHEKRNGKIYYGTHNEWANQNVQRVNFIQI